MPNSSLQTSPNQNPDHGVSDLGVAFHPKRVRALQALLNWTKDLGLGLRCLQPGWKGRGQLPKALTAPPAASYLGSSDPHPSTIAEPQQPPRPLYLSPELRLSPSQKEKCREGGLKPV